VSRARRLARVVLLALAAALLAAGCQGRLNDEQYQKQLDTVQRLRMTTLRGLPDHDLGDVQFFAKSSTQLSDAASQFDDVKPPGHVRLAHEKYVEALAGMGRVLGRFADCARLQARQPRAAVQCRRKIDQLEIDKVQNDFTEAETIYRQEGLSVREVAGNLDVVTGAGAATDAG
jgi:hypothetical protein